MNALDAPFVALDVEATGPDPERDAPVAVAAWRFEGHAPVAHWVTLVNPGRPIPPSATAIHGITDAMVANAPGIEVALAIPALRALFAGGAMPVAHNAAYDAAFLAPHLGLQRADFLCTLRLAKHLLQGRVADFRLATLAETLSIVPPEIGKAHDPRYDAYLAGALVKPLGIVAANLELGGASTLVALRARAASPITYTHALWGAEKGLPLEHSSLAFLRSTLRGPLGADEEVRRSVEAILERRIGHPAPTAREYQPAPARIRGELRARAALLSHKGI